MIRLSYLLITGILLFCSSDLLPSEKSPAKKLFAFRLSEPVKIDGILSEQVWQKEGFRDFFQQDPDNGSESTLPSEIWIAYDDDAVYFAGKFYDNKPDSIMARLVRRDFVWGDPSDGAIIYLDSYGDKRNGYFFYVNAAGTLADGLLENDSKQTDLSWDAVWEGVPHIDSEGWNVEMRIPYSQLRFKEGEDQVWGVNVERFISRKAETAMISYTPRNESGFASRFPELIGIEGISPRTRFELLPYVTGKAEYIRSAEGDPFNSGKEYTPNIGLDLRAGLGSSLTLNGTINPDFGQVEADPAVVNLTDVETSFEEKRPFFTEGVSIYRFGNGGTNNNWSFNWPGANIFYSRRIGRTPQGGVSNYDFADIPNGTHILGAAKISGRAWDEWKVGTIHALTNRESADIQFNGTRSSVEVEPLTYYSVFRMQRDFNSGNQGLGLLATFTNRFFKDQSLESSINKNALVTGIDGWTFLDDDRTYVLTGWAAVSQVSGDKNRITSLQKGPGHYFQRPDAGYINVDTNLTSLAGYAGRLMLNKNRGQFVINSAIGWLSPGFEVNDLGFGSYSDLINMHFVTSYRWTQPTEVYLNAGVNAATFAAFDFGGNKTSHGYFLGSYITLHNLYGGNINFTYNPETYNSRRTRGGPLTLNPVSRSFNFNMYTDNRLWWVLSAGANGRSGEDGRSINLYSTLEFKVTPTLTVSFGPSVYKNISEAQWVSAYNDVSANNTYNRRYIFAHLDQNTVAADIRADWIITPNLSFQVYIQPLVASGKYSQFKFLRKSSSFDFETYGNNGSTINKNISDGSITYDLDPDGAGEAESYTIGNPDFNYISLRGNAVLRWEYMPGSSLFLVWTQSREEYNPFGEFNFGNSVNNLFDVNPDNIFMLKISYLL